MSNEEIKFIEPTNVIQVHLPDGRTISGPRSAPLSDFMALIEEEGDVPVVGGIVNQSLRELTFPIENEANVIPVRMDAADGMRIYRRSLTMLLEAAFEELYPEASINIDHSVSFGGYYCQVAGKKPRTEDELEALKARMQALVAADMPFHRRSIPLKEAIQYFEEKGHQDKVRLLHHRKKDYLMLYFLGDHRDYHHGYMVPSTGYLKWFDLQLAEGGFTLRFPRRQRPTEILPLHDYPKLLETFRLYGDWLELMEIESAGSLNDAIQNGRIKEIVLVAEALHAQHISGIASQISAKQDEVRVVLIAGPSSSGKTTTSRRLSIQLLAQGVHPFPLELDNYFVDRDNTPKDENGDFDFEHIDALDRKRLNQDLDSLIAGKETHLPRYDFHTGQSGPGEVVKLRPNQVVILEGIHGLNPELAAEIPESKIFRIYISALTQLNLDRHNRVSTTDTRLIRRIVRDARSRGYTPQETIARWDSVRRGEKSNIFPYQENADVMFSSALAYELAALKPLAEPLLRQVPFGTMEHIEAKRLLALLEWFLPVDPETIPDNSLLREFVGGSIFQDFKLWENGK